MTQPGGPVLAHRGFRGSARLPSQLPGWGPGKDSLQAGPTCPVQGARGEMFTSLQNTVFWVVTQPGCARQGPGISPEALLGRLMQTSEPGGARLSATPWLCSALLLSRMHVCLPTQLTVNKYNFHRPVQQRDT